MYVVSRYFMHTQGFALMWSDESAWLGYISLCTSQTRMSYKFICFPYWDDVFIDDVRFLMYTALVMQMGKWCSLMLLVHKGYLVTCVINCFLLSLNQVILSFAYLLILIPLHFSWNVVVEKLCGRDNVLNHLSIPAACFTHPEISMVGLTEVNLRTCQMLSFFFAMMQLVCSSASQHVGILSLWWFIL